MFWKIQTVAFMLLLTMLFSGVVHGDNYDSAAAPLLDRIALGEGTSDVQAQAHNFPCGYDVPLGYGKYGTPSVNGNPTTLSQMTIGEVQAFQQQMIGNNAPSGAVGKYQITQSTLADLKSRLGLSDDTPFNAETQELLGRALLERRGYLKWMSGEISDHDFQKNLAKEWASIADPDTGMSYYGQNVGTTDAQIKEAMAQTKNAVLTGASNTGIQQPTSQVTSVASTTQGSESSVVGIWTLNADWECDGPINEPQSKLIFNSDGTFLTQTETHMGGVETSAGKWMQNGNNINLKYNDVTTVYDGTVQMDTMSGTMTLSDYTAFTGCWSAIRGEAASKKVTLTLSVHDGSASGPLVPGAQVTGRDGSGNIFQRTTDESGYIVIKGDPGTWSFSASAPGYETNNWDQDITDTCTKHAFLQKSVASTTQGSGNSVVGKWTVQAQYTNSESYPDCEFSPVTFDMFFDKDGTFKTSVIRIFSHIGGYDASRGDQPMDEWVLSDASIREGNWVQNGDIIRWELDYGPISSINKLCTYDGPSLTFEGTIYEDTMSGMGMDPSGDIDCYWSAVRVGTEESVNQGESTTPMDQSGITPLSEGITETGIAFGTRLPNGKSILINGIRVGPPCPPPKNGRPV